MVLLVSCSPKKQLMLLAPSATQMYQNPLVLSPAPSLPYSLNQMSLISVGSLLWVFRYYFLSFILTIKSLSPHDYQPRLYPLFPLQACVAVQPSAHSVVSLLSRTDFRTQECPLGWKVYILVPPCGCPWSFPWYFCALVILRGCCSLRPVKALSTAFFIMRKSLSATHSWVKSAVFVFLEQSWDLTLATKKSSLQPRNGHLCFFMNQVLTNRKNFQSGGYASVPVKSLVPVKSMEEASPSKLHKC